METTFITIQDLTPEARILYSSDSIVDILGFTPDQVVDRPSWDFFHEAELPVAKQLHRRGVNLDKAAVLAYCQLRNNIGQWVGCECCFTIVYNVMVVCISVYHRGMEQSKRSVEAPIVRRLFSSSPQDPRYHMLTVLSEKFHTENTEDVSHEPRAALFLNRFTRTATIMYATSGIEEIVGISSEDIKGLSFYFCIAENCLEDAVKCLETAKGNDSIAYLRFWFRDPRQNEPAVTSDEEMTEASVSGDDGTNTQSSSPELARQSTSSGPASMPYESASHPESSAHPMADAILQDENPHSQPNSLTIPPVNSRTSSGDTNDSINPVAASAAIFEQQDPARSSSAPLSSAPTTPGPFDGPIELEAVVSCTSDGLVVCLRKARPLIPSLPATPPQPRGIFAAPWAPEPVFFPPLQVEGFLGEPANGPSKAAFLNSIREVGAFAWALTGINGCLADYARGTPMHEAQPAGGFPVYDPIAPPDPDSGCASLASLDDEAGMKRDGPQDQAGPSADAGERFDGISSDRDYQEPSSHEPSSHAPTHQYHDAPTGQFHGDHIDQDPHY
ncbi:PAS domain-containing protein [Venturia nashicola]|uniref:PAS domain-containing protein n=1 Tax=Venturia nashicola TaxID=86259 RepID=A0A4Z1PN19_9PEZI|nr:PAS domain-containing protein [Venturia nashicola]TLD36311.1 PAS domain-containing protein [Venturia nashicola]